MVSELLSLTWLVNTSRISHSWLSPAVTFVGLCSTSCHPCSLLSMNCQHECIKQVARTSCVASSATSISVPSVSACACASLAALPASWCAATCASKRRLCSTGSVNSEKLFASSRPAHSLRSQHQTLHRSCSICNGCNTVIAWHYGIQVSMTGSLRPDRYTPICCTD